MTYHKHIVPHAQDAAFIVRNVIVPIQRGAEQQLVDAGINFGDVSYDSDIAVAKMLLEGGPLKVGSQSRVLTPIGELADFAFTEEDYKGQDTPFTFDLVRDAHTVISEDPCDGSGDLKKMGIPPTLIHNVFGRADLDEPFEAEAGFIMKVDDADIYALTFDGVDLQLLYFKEDGDVVEVPYQREYGFTPWNIDQAHERPLRINRRLSYSQDNYDGRFPLFLADMTDLTGFENVQVEHVPVGGAGTAQMQFFRNYITAVGPHAEAWNSLQPIDVYLNCQPDHKVWDTGAAEAIYRYMGREWTKFSGLTDVRGKPLSANIANEPHGKDGLEQMHHKAGYVMAPDVETREILTECVVAWEAASGMDITEMNY